MKAGRVLGNGRHRTRASGAAWEDFPCELALKAREHTRDDWSGPPQQLERRTRTHSPRVCACRQMRGVGVALDHKRRKPAVVGGYEESAAVNVCVAGAGVGSEHRICHLEDGLRQPVVDGKRSEDGRLLVSHADGLVRADGGNVAWAPAIEEVELVSARLHVLFLTF